MKPYEIFRHWTHVRKELFETLAKFSDEELKYKPFNGSWTVGQIVLHIAEAEDFWFTKVVQGQEVIEPDFTLEQAGKDQLVNWLNFVHNKTLVFLNGLENEKDLERIYALEGEEFSLYFVLWHVIEHEIHHRGELSLCLGLLGREGLDV
jgi:uncharacterized damage-inducible protein DinB